MNAVIVGASSGVGRALAEKLASLSWNVVLSARNERNLEAVKSNIEALYGIQAYVFPIDLAANFSSEEYFKKCREYIGEIDAIFIPAGVSTGDDGMVAQDKIDQLIKVNYASIVQLLAVFLPYFKQRNKGRAVVISSIAAAAPRKLNVVYASAKKALETYCAGMQHAFAHSPVDIKVFALGYVDTALTKGLDLPLPMASPEQVASYIAKSMHQNFRHRYYPRFWVPITFVLRHTPWFIYKRLSF